MAPASECRHCDWQMKTAEDNLSLAPEKIGEFEKVFFPLMATALEHLITTHALNPLTMNKDILQTKQALEKAFQEKKLKDLKPKKISLFNMVDLHINTPTRGFEDAEIITAEQTADETIHENLIQLLLSIL